MGEAGKHHDRVLRVEQGLPLQLCCVDAARKISFDRKDVDLNFTKMVSHLLLKGIVLSRETFRDPSPGPSMGTRMKA